MKKNLIKEVTKKLIKEQQEFKKLSEAIEYDPQHPERMHPSLEKQLKQDTHHLGGNPSFPKGDRGHFSEKIASDRFKDLVTKVKRYWDVSNLDPRMMQQVFRLLGEIKEIESKHRKELEQLAVDIVRSEFDIPAEDVDIDAKLVDNISSEGMKSKPKKTEEPEIESLEDKEKLDAEVHKRRMVNSLIQGASKKGHYMFHLVENELSTISPRLSTLYGKLMSLTDFTYWLIPDMSGSGGGSSDGGSKGGRSLLNMDGEKPKIIAEAWIFPVLIHELIKGAMELLSLHGLPENPKHAQYVIDKADFLDAEVWDMRLGPGIWEKFIDAIPGEAYDIKQHLYYDIVKMPADEFHSFMRELLSGTNKGKQKLVDLANEIKKEIESDRAKKAIEGGSEKSSNLFGGDDDDDNLDDIDISDLFS